MSAAVHGIRCVLCEDQYGVMARTRDHQGPTHVVAEPHASAGGMSISLQGLCKRFGTVSAVESLTLAIRAKEFVTLLGPSGSGKTTTLMMIAGFQTPSAGEIWLGDQPISRLPPHRRDLGVVFQNYALFPHLTVYENVAFPLKMRHLLRDETARRVTEALELVKLPGYERRFPHQLSGGQQQRVALARALVFRPAVVLMDEPLGALDKQLREHMQLEIKYLQRALGMTVVYVTHDQSEALTMSDRIVVMNRGRLEQVGPPEELYERPTTRFVAGFLGESNFLEGNVIESRGFHGVIVVVGGLRVAATAPVPCATGSRVTLMVRPEKIVLDANGNEPENEFSGTIEEAIYSGNYAKYRIRLDPTAGVEVLATQPIRSALPKLTPGRVVRVSWTKDDAQVILDGAGQACGEPSRPVSGATAASTRSDVQRA